MTEKDMKLLIVANYAKEHINKFHLSTIKRFVDEGWQVDVACNVDTEIPFCNKTYHINWERNPFNPGIFSHIAQLKKIIKTNEYDFIHCHTLCGRVIGTLATKPLKKSGTKLVITYHGLNYFKGSSWYSKLLVPLDIYLSRFADLSFSDNNEDIMYGNKLNLSLGNCIFCPPSSNYSKFTPNFGFKMGRDETRRALGLTKNEITLVYVAEVNANKNQKYLINILNELLKINANFRLVLIGPQKDAGKTAQYVDDLKLLNKVLFLGWRSDIAELLCACDIYTASSIREGFGVNLVEAALCELPVVATDNRGHREIIEDGYNGFLIPLDDIPYAVKKITEISDDEVLSKRLARNGIENFEKAFAKKTEDIIFDAYTAIM